MKKITQDYLTDLNRAFYQEISPLWNNESDYIWEGWLKILPLIHQLPDTIHVLDLGSGNGRFANFLIKYTDKEVYYTGVDNHADWVKNHVIQDNPRLHIQLDITDVRTLELERSYDLIVAFGLLHHIPGADNRARLIKLIQSHTLDHGLWTYTWWNFLHVPRLFKRTVPEDQLQTVVGELVQDFEEGDFILDWVKQKDVFRYSHFPNKSEFDPKKDIHFACDGRHSNRNIYVLNKEYQ